ncbi:MAG: BolA family protein [Hyphomonadaceae bacterium]
MKNASSRASRMEAALQDRFTPSALSLSDDSARHAGHAGARPEGETHFTIRMVSAAFSGLNRVTRQRLVHEALKQEFDGGLHALSLELKAPGET